MSESCDTSVPCTCEKSSHAPKLIVVTGGPGAGKTALLELIRKNFCEHIQVLPEAATILFGGGFWRHESLAGREAGQKAIYHVQRALEEIVLGEQKAAIGICDRGTLDGLAYWPGREDDFWREVNSSKEKELSRYAAVIHLQTPTPEHGYNFRNPQRIETAERAAVIDAKISDIWKDHPKVFFVGSKGDFMEKVASALDFLREQLPECCRGHSLRRP